MNALIPAGGIAVVLLGAAPAAADVTVPNGPNGAAQVITVSAPHATAPRAVCGWRAVARDGAGVHNSPRCTETSGWLQSADRWEATECAVTASSVVVLEPGCKGCGSVVVAGEDLPVGPFGL